MKLSSFAYRPLTLAIGLTGTLIAFSASAQKIDVTATNTKIAVIDGAKYSFNKIVDAQGEVKTQVLNSDGKEIPEREVPFAKIEKFDPRLVKWVNEMRKQGNYSATLKVDIALNLGVNLSVPVETAFGEIRNGETASGVVNGRELGAKELNLFGDTSAESLRKLQREANAKRSAVAQRWAEANKLLDAKGVRESLARGEEGLTVYVDVETLVRLIETNDTMVAGVEPTAEFKDDIAGAMNATNITNWALPFSNRGSRNFPPWIT